MGNIVVMVAGKSHSGKGEFSIKLESILKETNMNIIRCSLSTYIRKIAEEDFYCNDMESVEARKFMAEVYRLGTEIYPYHMARRVWERDIVPYFKNRTNIIIVESFRELHNYVYFNKLKDEGKISKIITINITRPNFSVLNEEMKKHISETDLDNFKFDYVIVNDKNIEDLHEKVNKISNEIISLSEKFISYGVNINLPYGTKVKIIKILDLNSAEHLIEYIGLEGYVVSKITYKGIDRYKIMVDLGTRESAYFRYDELEVIE